MSLTPNEIDQYAIKFPKEHAEQIKVKSERYGVSLEDGSQDVSLIIMEKGPEFDPTKGTLSQFIFGHWEKRMRRQRGVHTFAISLDRDDIIGERARAQIENMTAPSDDDCEEVPFPSDQATLAKILLIARFISGKSISDIARSLGLTPRRVRQMLQQVREKKTIPERLLFCVEQACRS